MMKQKQSVVDATTKGVEFLMKKNKITWLKGTGKLLGGGKVEVTGADAGTVSAKHIVIATGSEVMPLKGIEIDRSEEHTSELQSLMRISYAVFCLKKTREITTPWLLLKCSNLNLLYLYLTLQYNTYC